MTRALNGTGGDGTSLNFGRNVFLEKMNALAAHYHSIRNELLTTLRNATVEPTGVPENADWIPNVYLRTRPDPEIEAATRPAHPMPPEQSSRLDDLADLYDQVRSEYPMAEEPYGAIPSPPTRGVEVVEGAVRFMFSGRQ